MRLKIAESSSMAKKDKAPEADDGAEKPEGGEAPAKKRAFGEASQQEDPDDRGSRAGRRPGRKAGAGTYFFIIKPHGAEKDKVAKAEAIPLTPPEVAFSDVPDILVNIQSNDGTPAYLKLSLSLEMENDLAKTGMTALMPRLVDQFQSYLRELRLDDLKGSEGVLRLKEELLRRADAAAAPIGARCADDVLLKQMIVQ